MGIRCLPEGNVDLHPRARPLPHPDTLCSPTTMVESAAGSPQASRPRRRRRHPAVRPNGHPHTSARSSGRAVLRRDRCTAELRAKAVPSVRGRE